LNKKEIRRALIATVYTISVMAAIGKWAIWSAYVERGYKAVGGEYLLIFMAGMAAWSAINYYFDSLEELEHERNRKKRRSGAAARLRDNR